MPTTTPSLAIQCIDNTRTATWASLRVRTIPVIVLTAAIMILGTTLWLDANPAGLGTHQQLGLPPCGFLASTRLPCATCGMTTAFVHAAHGRLLTSLLTQPAGMVFAIFTAMCAIISLWALTVGAPLEPVLRWLWRPITVWLLAVLVISSWVYKVLAIYWGVQI